MIKFCFRHKLPDLPPSHSHRKQSLHKHSQTKLGARLSLKSLLLICQFAYKLHRHTHRFSLAITCPATCFNPCSEMKFPVDRICFPFPASPPAGCCWCNIELGRKLCKLCVNNVYRKGLAHKLAGKWKKILLRSTWLCALKRDKSCFAVSLLNFFLVVFLIFFLGPQLP